MAKVVAGMIMSMDGFVQDRAGSVAALYPDLDAFVKTRLIQDEIRTTGAVVMGRHAYGYSAGRFHGL
jgi:dihydrofolate reductase